MPKRRPEKLTGIRIELQERDRELVEQAIIGNTVGKVAQGLGTAVGGLGLAVGIVAGVAVFKEGVEVFGDFLEKDRTEWERKNISATQYEEYNRIRPEMWEAYAKEIGRYGPAIGDEANPSWWRRMDPEQGVVEQPLTFQDWERPRGPQMLYDEWANTKRAEETARRKRKLGYGYLQEWWQNLVEWDWEPEPGKGW